MLVRDSAGSPEPQTRASGGNFLNPNTRGRAPSPSGTALAFPLAGRRRRQRDADAHPATLVAMSTAETHLPTCYRHPDRETGLSCSECGRPICTECMTAAPVGLRCPEHAGKTRGPKVGGRQLVLPQTRIGGTEALVTKALIAINVVIYLITAVQGNGLEQPGGSLWNNWALYGPLVHHGDWWRLITAAFLHASIVHIAFNMLALWWIGAPVEQYLGRARFLGL
jgi:hypothetical protein